MQPDESLPGHASPYQMFFRRSPRTSLDQMTPTLDNTNAALGLEPTIEETRPKHVEVSNILQKRQEEKSRHREQRNANIKRKSPGAKAQVGHKVLVRESASTLHRDGIHPKMAHDHFTGPWVVSTRRAELHDQTQRSPIPPEDDSCFGHEAVLLETAGPLPSLRGRVLALRVGTGLGAG